MYETGNHSMLVSKLWNYEEKIKHFNIRKAKIFWNILCELGMC